MKLSQINSIISQIKGTTFASLDSTTEEKLSGGKKNPHLGRVTKKTDNIRIILFASMKGYENMVKRRLIKEGKNPDDFKVASLPWGNRISEDSPIIEHNGNYYIQTIAQGSGQSRYFLDNREVEKESIIGMKEPTKSVKQNLDNEVVVRTFKLDSIREIRLMGETIAS